MYDDAQAYFDDRSETWYGSEKGQVFATWLGQLERLADFGREPTDEVLITIDLAGDLRDALPDLPEMPDLEE